MRLRNCPNFQTPICISLNQTTHFRTTIQLSIKHSDRKRSNDFNWSRANPFSYTSARPDCWLLTSRTSSSPRGIPRLGNPSARGKAGWPAQWWPSSRLRLLAAAFQSSVGSRSVLCVVRSQSESSNTQLSFAIDLQLVSMVLAVGVCGGSSLECCRFFFRSLRFRMVVFIWFLCAFR